MFNPSFIGGGVCVAHLLFSVIYLVFSVVFFKFVISFDVLYALCCLCLWIVLYALCCLCLWIVHSRLPLRFSLFI